MNWAKAKTILIVALLITDFILVGLLCIENERRDGPGEGDLQEDTILLLQSHGIQIETEIPTKTKKMPVLFVKYDQEDEKKVEAVLSAQKPLPKEQQNEEGYRAAAEVAMKKMGIKRKSAEYQRMTKDEEFIRLRYEAYYEGYQICESHMEFVFYRGKLIHIDRVWLEPSAFGKNKKKTMSALTALIKFMAAEEEKGATEEKVVVNEIRLVYWLEGYVSDTGSSVSEDTAVPSWCITYNGGEKKYITAYEQ